MSFFGTPTAIVQLRHQFVEHESIADMLALPHKSLDVILQLLDRSLLPGRGVERFAAVAQRCNRIRVDSRAKDLQKSSCRIERVRSTRSTVLTVNKDRSIRSTGAADSIDFGSDSGKVRRC
jgi:hypothetical protein